MKQLKTYSLVLFVLTILFLAFDLWLIDRSHAMDPSESLILGRSVFVAYALAVSAFFFWIAFVSQKGSKLIPPALIGGIGYLIVIAGYVMNAALILKLYNSFEMDGKMLSLSITIIHIGFILFALAIGWLSFYFKKLSIQQILGFLVAVILIAVIACVYCIPAYGSDWDYQVVAFVEDTLTYSSYAAFFYAFSRIKA